MILEVATLGVIEGREREFEAAFNKAQGILSSTISMIRFRQSSIMKRCCNMS